MCILFVR